MCISQKNIAIRRFLAFVIDYLVIMAWAGILFGVVMLVFSGKPPAPSGPWRAQILGFFSMTLPVILYFSICERSSMHGTFGKRILSLEIIDDTAVGISFSRLLYRNIIKFAPWEMGHLVANQALFSTSTALPDWIFVPMLLAVALPLWWVISIFVNGTAPYDQISGLFVKQRKNGPSKTEA